MSSNSRLLDPKHATTQQHNNTKKLKKPHFKTTQQLKQLNKQKNEQQFQTVGSTNKSGIPTEFETQKLFQQKFFPH